MHNTQLEPLRSHSLWLLDSLHSLWTAQIRWESVIEPSWVPVVEAVLELMSSESDTSTAKAIRKKGPVVLVLICAEIAKRPYPLTTAPASADAAKQVYYRALAQLAKNATENRAIGRLIASHLLGPLELLSTNHATIHSDTSFEVRLVPIPFLHVVSYP